MSRNAEAPYVERVSQVTSINVDGDIYTVNNLRAMTWSDPPNGREIHWRSESFDVNELTNVYFVIGWWNAFKSMAHTMLSFEFADGRVVTASVEIRQQVGREYNALAGFKKTYKLSYLWSTESDAIISRVFSRTADRIHLIEAVLSQQAAVRIFEACVERTNELAERDEYYHTLNNSCTTNIFDIVETAIPDNFKRPAKRVLPGRTPRFLAKNGALRMQGDFEETLKATAVSDRVLEIGDVEDFSRLLRDR